MTQLKTDYGSGYTETAVTNYEGGGVAAMGLPGTVSTTVISPAGGTQVAPVKSYTYLVNGTKQTPLVLTETDDGTSATGGNGNLKLTTTNTYNAGRISSKTIWSPDTSIGSYQTYAATAWDSTLGRRDRHPPPRQVRRRAG